ncbi:MAG TPA: beta-N-acetylglucosaminidase domain-containing protein [Acidimicrobiales bacterium]
MAPLSRIRPAVLLAAVGLLLTTAVGCSGDGDDDSVLSPSVPHDGDGSDGGSTTRPRPADAPLPGVVPTPHDLRWLGDDDLVVPESVAVVSGDGVDQATVDLVTGTLQAAGASTVEAVRSAEAAGADPADAVDDAGLVVVAGLVDAEPVAAALDAAGVEAPADLPAEGYVLAVDADAGSVVIAGRDGDGVYYGAHTLRQVVDGDAIAGVVVVDRPSQARRGVVEGFYGSPWTHEERLDQLAFYGRVKLNTYQYAPKADPYHRDRWREPYPAAELDRLRQLVEAATANHVRFDFAVSPGVSICYSSADDVAALEAKLTALYDVGVRHFTIALDDIEYDRWNCDGDRARYGPNTGASAAQAQVELLNGLQERFVASHEGTAPLTLVPTEYRNTDDSPYKQVVRRELAPEIQVMWTGDMVVPAEITADQARAAGERFGRPVTIWDNYPVNDFDRTTGRLLLAPYARREPAMVEQVAGVIANPMNQAAASKVALVGVADITWNAPAYDPARAHRAAAEWLASGGGEGEAAPEAVDALLAFFDLNHLSPTSARSAATVSQPQAPALAERLSAFEATWAAGDRAGAIAALRPYAELLAGAAGAIREGVADEGFLADCRPWLDALDLWGRAFVAHLDGLQAEVDGDQATADARFAEVANLAAQARAIHTIEGETLPQGPIKLGDTVLDAFLNA